MVRFLHTSDWQLGMTRYYFTEGAQERYNQSRFDAIRTMGCIAREKECDFMLVSGDVFESNQVDRKTVARAMEALKDVPVPVFILPGNHDPLNAASVYCSRVFLERKPPNVQVIENTMPIQVVDGVELVGAPWMSKRPALNPLGGVIDELPPIADVIRIVVAHGSVDRLVPNPEAPGVISVAAMEQAIAEGKIHFVALGDRHSLTKVGGSDRIWYSGTPESTDFREVDSGNALVVELEVDRVNVTAISIGHWSFVERERVDINSQEDLEALRQWLEDLPDKERTAIRLNAVGTVTLALSSTLQSHILSFHDVFASVNVRDEELVTVPDDSDFKDLGFSGFANAAVQRLRKEIEDGGGESSKARDALMLLRRLAGGTK